MKWNSPTHMVVILHLLTGMILQARYHPGRRPPRLKIRVPKKTPAPSVTAQYWQVQVLFLVLDFARSCQTSLPFRFLQSFLPAAIVIFFTGASVPWDSNNFWKCWLTKDLSVFFPSIRWQEILFWRYPLFPADLRGAEEIVPECALDFQWQSKLVSWFLIAKKCSFYGDMDTFFTGFMIFFHICFSVCILTDHRDDGMILMVRKDDDQWSMIWRCTPLCWTCMNPKIEKAKNAIGKTGEAMWTSPKMANSWCLRLASLPRRQPGMVFCVCLGQGMGQDWVLEE